MLAFMLLNLNLHAQPGTIQWERNYGGSDWDFAHSVQQTDDSGYIVAGYSLSNDGDVTDNNGNDDFNGDYWLVRLDASGTILWESNYGGSDDDAANSVQQTNDGGYIVGGNSSSDDVDVSGNNGNLDNWVVKLDASGIIQWENNYGGSDDDRLLSVQQTDDGGYILAGRSNSDDGDVSGNNGDSDCWVVKLDSLGSIQWESNYGGSDDDYCNSVQQTEDGGYILAGVSESVDFDLSGNNGNRDYWLVKLDFTGTILWENNYGGSDDDEAKSVQQTDDGGYIVAGQSESNDGDVSGNNGQFCDYWLLKLDASGTILWERNYGGNDDDEARSVQQTNDGGYILVGEARSADVDVSGNNGFFDYWVLKLDSSGTIQWESNYGGSSGDEALSVQQTGDGGYIVAGRSRSDDIDVSGNNGDFDYWLVKLSGTLSTDDTSTAGEIQTSLYPNPTHNNITVEAKGAKAPLKVIMRDITGRSVSEHKIENSSSFHIEITQEAGIYMLELKDAAGRKTTRKVIKK